MLAGAHFKTVDLTPGEKPATGCTWPATAPPRVEIAPDDVAHYKRLVAEALALFGARHYANYHFLLTLSDHIPSNGLEHHESSDNRAARALVHGRRRAEDRSGRSCSHEYVHSWNGKYRRPDGLVSGVRPTTRQPWTATCSGSTRA